MTLPICDTTLTPRLPVTFCINSRLESGCDTYPDNLGPCETFEAGKNGRCVYCDHSILCHPIASRGKMIRSWFAKLDRWLRGR